MGLAFRSADVGTVADYGSKSLPSPAVNLPNIQKRIFMIVNILIGMSNMGIFHGRSSPGMRDVFEVSETSTNYALATRCLTSLRRRLPWLLAAGSVTRSIIRGFGAQTRRRRRSPVGLFGAT